jgi:hypothetical protein
MLAIAIDAPMSRAGCNATAAECGAATTAWHPKQAAFGRDAADCAGAPDLGGNTGEMGTSNAQPEGGKLVELQLSELGKVLLAVGAIAMLAARLWASLLITRMVRGRRPRPPTLPPIDTLFNCTARRQLARLRAAREDRAEALAAGALRGPIGERLVSECAELERAALELIAHGDSLARYLQQLRCGLLALRGGTPAAVHGARLQDAQGIQAIQAELQARGEILLSTLEAVPAKVMNLRARELAGRARARQELAAEAAGDIDGLLRALDAALDPPSRDARGSGTADAA